MVIIFVLVDNNIYAMKELAFEDQSSMETAHQE